MRLILCVNADADACDKQDRRHYAKRDQCELPLNGESHDERSYESGDALYGEGKLLRNTVVNIVAVGRGLNRDRSGCI